MSSLSPKHEVSRLHADRTAGRDRDHRGPDRPALAGGPGGPRGGQADAVRQQPQADRPGDPQLPLDLRLSSRWASRNTCPVTSYNWDSWSSHALMLGHLEQTQLYNACNFSLGNNMPNSYRLLCQFDGHQHEVDGLPVPVRRERRLARRSSARRTDAWTPST